jgi:HEAT repeat protein
VTRLTIALTLALGACACASAPPAPVRPPAPTFEEKTSWILRLEDQRVLRDSATAAADLPRLLADEEARIRRRAALAIGRVGLREGTAPLIGLLKDPDVEVRQMAAFALGLIGDPGASAALIAALEDPSPLMTGSAAEALGLIGDAAAAPAVGRMVGALVASGAVNDPPADQENSRATPATAFRLGVTALVRLQAYDALAAAVLDASGQPRVRFWPVAFALQRLEDRRALPALISLAGDRHPYTQAFAAKGLGAMQDRRAGVALLPLLTSPERSVAIEAIRSLARLREPGAGAALLSLIRAAGSDPQVRLEAVSALGSVGSSGTATTETLIDLMGDQSPEMRAAAIRSFARLDAEAFVTVLSGLDLDDQWRVRSAMAGVLGTLTPEAGGPRLRAMLADPEPRVVPAVLDAMTALGLPDAAPALLERLTADDFVIRAAAARGLEKLKPQGGAAALVEAYARGAADKTYVARAAALSALAAYGQAEATPVLTQALADPDWAVRVKAAQLLRQLDPASDADARIRPAPALAAERYQAGRLVSPPFST